MGIFSRLRAAMGGHPPVGIAGALSGDYDFRNGRLVGNVFHQDRSVKETLEVSVLRYAELKVHVLATCQAVVDRADRRYRFSIPVNDLFSGADLLTNFVKVMAFNDRGDSGELELDSVTQIELIRDHLGIPADTVIDLDFSRGGNASACTGEGWSGAEAEFTWTQDDDSWISFDSPTEAGPYRLRIKSEAYVKEPDLPSQAMAVFVNEEFVGSIASKKRAVQFEEFKVPFGAFELAPRTRLRLHHPNAARPCDISDSPDSRRIAFALKRLWLVRLKPEDEPDPLGRFT